jgi:hypothetical protein
MGDVAPLIPMWFWSNNHRWETGVGLSYLLDKALRALVTDVISVAQILLHPALVISL